MASTDNYMSLIQRMNILSILSIMQLILTAALEKKAEITETQTICTLHLKRKHLINTYYI